MAHVELSKQFDLDTVITLQVGNGIIASATTKTGTPYISMAKSHFIAFIITANDATLAGKVSAHILEATGTSTAATLKTTADALKSTTFAAGTGDINSVKVLEVQASELDVANGYSCVALRIKTAGADTITCSIIRGPNRYEPAGYV